jgi:hypothetical protein
MKKNPAALLALLAMLPLSGCDQPPAKEIAAAESALAQAQKDGADSFAPEQWKAAGAALAHAREKVEAKDYRGALSSAIDASEKARTAASAAASAKLLARSAAEVAQAEAQAALDEVAAVKGDAAKLKVPESAFAEPEAKADAVRRGLAGIAATLEKGDLLAAQKDASELKAGAATLAQAFHDAFTQWQDAHAKGRKPAKPPTKKP